MTQGRGYEDRSWREDVNYRLREVERRTGSMVQYGRVTEVDYEKRRAKVEFFPEDQENQLPARKTGWIPWSQGLNDKGAQDWQPLDVDSQVAVLGAAGDPANGLIVPAGVNYHDEENERDYRPWVKKEDEDSEEVRKNTFGRKYRDGTEDSHNTKDKHRKITIPDGGTFTVSVGSSSIVMNGSSVTIKTSTFKHQGTDTILDAFVHIGGQGGVPVSKQGTMDNCGCADTSNLATRAVVT